VLVLAMKTDSKSLNTHWGCNGVCLYANMHEWHGNVFDFPIEHHCNLAAKRKSARRYCRHSAANFNSASQLYNFEN
jgi:hypothetical protein